jgi:hypothetical protein
MHACVIGDLLDSSIFSVRIEHNCRTSRARSQVSCHYRVTFNSEHEDAGAVGPDDNLVLQIFQHPNLISQVGPEQTTEKCKIGAPHVVSANRVEENDAGVNAALDIETMKTKCNSNMWTFDRDFDGMNDSRSALWPATTWRLQNFNLSYVYANQADAHNDALCDRYKNTTMRNLTSSTFWCRECSYCTLYLIISNGEVHRRNDNIANCEPSSCNQFTGDISACYEIESATSIGGVSLRQQL